MNEWTTYAGRLIWAMQHAGQTNQSELARAIGIKPQSIQYLCRPDAGAQGSKHTAALAEALGVSSQWLARNEGLPSAIEAGGLNATEAAGPGYTVTRDGLQVAVTEHWRVSGAGEVDAMAPSAGPTLGHLLLPLVPRSAVPLRAARITGNALSPFVKDGQYLVLQAGKVHPEENVLITLRSGRRFIREVLHDKPDVLVVLPLHGGQPEAIERRDIADFMPVIAALPGSRWLAS